MGCPRTGVPVVMTSCLNALSTVLGVASSQKASHFRSTRSFIKRTSSFARCEYPSLGSSKPTADTTFLAYSAVRRGLTLRPKAW